MPIKVVTLTETGCYLDNHRGHYISRDVIDLATEYGFIIDPCDEYVVRAYEDHNCDDDYPHESIAWMCDAAVNWLNNGQDSRIEGQNYAPIIPEGTSWGFDDGDFGLYHDDDGEDF